MLVPSRVLIISNKEGSYYDKFVGTEHNVVDSDMDLITVTLQIPDDTGKETHTIWYNGEYEVLDWDDNETVTISKAEYDELLESLATYKQLYQDIQSNPY